MTRICNSRYACRCMAELDDAKRLAVFDAALVQLDADRVLQDYVERAARSAQAPIAMITFVMKKILLLRAAVGLPPGLEATRATSRGYSFCQYVVKGEAPFIVQNVASDPRVSKLRTDAPGLVAYAGVPLRIRGQIVGSLCVADHRPRAWQPGLVEQLQQLAEHASQRLEALIAQAGCGDDLTAMPTRCLASRAAMLAQVVQRSLAEVGPMVRLGRGVTGGLSPDALRHAGNMLGETNDYYDEMLEVVLELCVATRRVAESMLTQPAASA